MLRVGETVRIISQPADNRHWDIPIYLINETAVVENIRERDIHVRLTTNQERWSFPLDYDGVLERYALNKWNTMNYVSPFKPLNLP